MRKEKIIENNYYHIYNRGVNRQDIFYSPGNMQYFLNKLIVYFKKEKVALLAYCLMPNHYHLLVKVNQKNFSQLVMHPLMISYTKAINKQKDRVGPLFQGNFKAKLIEKMDDVVYISRYIHLNPVKAGLTTLPQDWVFSSYCDYITETTKCFTDRGEILSYFNSRQAYADYIMEKDDE